MKPFQQFLAERYGALFPITQHWASSKWWESVVEKYEFLQDVVAGKRQANKKMVDDARKSIAYVFEKMVDLAVNDPYYLEKDRDARTANETEVYYAFNSLNNCAATIKKFGHLKGTSKMIDAALALANEYLPVVQLTADLKSAPVMSGRIPDPNAVPRKVNLNQVRGTCGWCRRNVAVDPNQHYPAHHGYQRPGEQYQTPSCPGIAYKCIEISDEGIVARLNGYKVAVKQRKQDLEALPKLKSVPYGKNRVVSKGDPLWKMAQSAYAQRLEREMQMSQAGVAETKEELSKWKPVW